MRSKNVSLLVCAVLLTSSLLPAQQAATAPVATAANNPAASKNALRVSASPDHDPLTLSLADLKALPHITVTIHNSYTNADETYSGVLTQQRLKARFPLGI